MLGADGEVLYIDKSRLPHLAHLADLETARALPGQEDLWKRLRCGAWPAPPRRG